MAELMSRIEHGQWITAGRQIVAAEEPRTFGTRGLRRIEIKQGSCVGIEGHQVRVLQGRGRDAGKEGIRQPGKPIVEGQGFQRRERHGASSHEGGHHSTDRRRANLDVDSPSTLG